MENTVETPENIDKLKNRIAELELHVNHYEQLILPAKRRQFGTSSEKTYIDINQMSLFGCETYCAAGTASKTARKCQSRKPQAAA